MTGKTGQTGRIGQAKQDRIAVALQSEKESLNRQLKGTSKTGQEDDRMQIRNTRTEC